MIFQFPSYQGQVEQSAERSLHIASQLERDGHCLRDRFEQLRFQVLSKKVNNPNDQLTQAIGIAAAAMKQYGNAKPYPTQILAAHWMSRGMISEMATGEGKSFAVLLTAVALSAIGWNVHIATANDYLADRDSQLASSVISALGLSSGCLQANLDRQSARPLYESDLVYGTLAQFAFDYLQDQIQLQNCNHARVFHAGRYRQACHRRHCLLIDEIDHCLIDEASTPFIISESPANESDLNEQASLPYLRACAIAQNMEEGVCYHSVADGKQIELTTRGFELARATQPAVPLLRPWSDYLMNAIRSQVVLHRDIDYVVRGQEIRLIDKATGRFAEGRLWQDGLHQAIQCKERVAVDQEQVSRAKITADQFVSLYAHVAGCSGTASDCKKEFASVYGMKVCTIPEFRPCQRQIWPPTFCRDQAQKRQAIVDEVLKLQASGRPILIGTPSIARSNQLAQQLRSAGVRIQMLNGTQDRAEADVIAHAGRHGAITVATDMAGRGTDIPIDHQVEAIGGLHVIVSEVGHSPRLDRQMIGRTARQGQPGSARVFVSADDELIQQFSPSLTRLLTARPSDAYDGRQLWNEVLNAGLRSDRQAALQRAAAYKLSQQRQPGQHSLYA